jgi:hypothetical protein
LGMVKPKHRTPAIGVDVWRRSQNRGASFSPHVRRLKRAGLVIFGRTNPCELGLSLTCEPVLYGPTKSPWDTTRISARYQRWLARGCQGETRFRASAASASRRSGLPSAPAARLQRQGLPAPGWIGREMAHGNRRRRLIRARP